MDRRCGGARVTHRAGSTRRGVAGARRRAPLRLTLGVRRRPRLPHRALRRGSRWQNPMARTAVSDPRRALPGRWLETIWLLDVQRAGFRRLGEIVDDSPNVPSGFRADHEWHAPPRCTTTGKDQANLVAPPRNEPTGAVSAASSTSEPPKHRSPIGPHMESDLIFFRVTADRWDHAMDETLKPLRRRAVPRAS